MTATNYVFAVFIAIGLLFFYLGCYAAAKPTPGTTEWIDYQCGRQFRFCPQANTLSYIDLIPALLLAALAFAATQFSAIHILSKSIYELSTPLLGFLDNAVFSIGNGIIYPAQLLWVLTILVLYIFLKRTCEGYFVPICGILLLIFDYNTAIISQDIGKSGATFFILLAFYLSHAYISGTEDVSSLLAPHFLIPIGLCLGIGMCFNISGIFSVIGITVVYLVKILHTCYLEKQDIDSDIDAKQYLKSGIYFILSAIILPIVIYYLISGVSMYAYGSYTNIQATITELSHNLTSQLTANTKSLIGVFTTGLPLWMGGILALPCCIYLSTKAKDGNSLFVTIAFTTFIIQIIFIPDIGGMLPVFAVTVISRAMKCLERRRLKRWIFVYMIASALYFGFMYFSGGKLSH